MWKYLKKYWYFALLAPLCMLGEVTMDLLQPTMMSKIVDDGVLGSDLSIVVKTGILMIIVTIIGGGCGFLSGVFANYCSQNFSNDLRKDCFRRIMSFSFEQTDTFSTGSLVTRITNDVTQVQNFVSQMIRGAVRTTLMFLGGIFFMLRLNLHFGVVIGCVMPIVFITLVLFMAKASPLYALLQKKLDKVNSILQENVAGARVVKAYVREEKEQQRFHQGNEELIETQLRALRLFSVMNPLVNIMMNTAVVAIIYVGNIEVSRNQGMTPGVVMAAITYTTQILHSVLMLGMLFQNISRGMASIKRLKEVLDTAPSITDGTKKMPEKADREQKGKIEFRNVSFTYPGTREAVLEKINLVINPGETIGILGSTGCGKTSFVQLIPRFYDVTEGEILLDGVNIKEYALKELRERVTIAMQKSELFHVSILENIAWGKKDASFEEIREAAKIAQADEFIMQQKDGYDTLVTESGTSLSGGQKQRIAISRAVLKKSDILILDDATSALDLKTEANLYESLKRSGHKQTKIIVAQRIASVRNADRIALIENGTIVACAQHEVLLAENAMYQDIYNSQLKKEEA